MSSENTERTLQLGRIGRTVGLDGGLLFHASGPAEAELMEAGLSVSDDSGRELRVAAVRRHNRGLVVHFEGVRRVERARELTNRDVGILASQLPEGFSAFDLAAGLTGVAVFLENREIGRVAEISGAAGHEYLLLEPGGQLIPLNAPYVQVEDSRVLLADPPDGLL